MKQLLGIILLIVITKNIMAQKPLRVDFRYAPDWYVTCIGLPDDTIKTLVGPLGQLLYDNASKIMVDLGGKQFFKYNKAIELTGFNTVVHILPDEDIKFTDQKLYSPKVPIVETYGVINDMEVKQEIFSYSSAGIKDYGKKEGWQERKENPREDIILTNIYNNTGSKQIYYPQININSEFKVTEKNNVITINNKQKLFFNGSVVRIRQNLDNYKTIVEFEPIAIEPGNKSIFVSLYDNGISSELCQALNSDPKNTVTKLEEIKKNIIKFWEKESTVPFGHIKIPDKEIQALIDASLRNIWQAREIKDNRFSFNVGPTVYRDLWICDGAFFMELATMVNRGDEARDGLEYVLSFQESNGKFGKLFPDYYKENGMVIWSCVRHAMLTQDKEWLISIWPKLSKTVNFINELREMTYEDNDPLNDGLTPNGFIDGGITGGKDIAEYTNTYWNLAGFNSMIEAAKWLGKTSDEKRWQSEYDEYFNDFKRSAERDLDTDSFGNRYLPIVIDPSKRTLPQRAQWAFCHAIYPGKIFSKDDPIAKGTMDMLHTTLQEGMVMGTGWIIDGIWNYFASFYGHANLWMNDGDKAVRDLYAFANHASPLLAWREEHNPRDLERSFLGDMPHNWASVEFVRLAVHLLALDRGNELHLFEGLPEEWIKPGMKTALNEISTRFGKITFSLIVNGLGDSAEFKINKLSDDSCEKVVVHFNNDLLELDPKEDHNLTLKIN